MTDPVYAEQEMEWDGRERRSIPFQLINYVDEKLDAHANRVTGAFKSHEVEEMERYGEIIDKQNDLIDKYDQLENKLTHVESLLDRNGERMNKIAESVNTFMESNNEFFSCIKRAFPKDDEGKPDYDGHKKAHLSWISNAKDEKEVMEYVRKQMKSEGQNAELLMYVKKVIFAGAAFAVVSFVAIATWAAFLKGPAV